MHVLLDICSVADPCIRTLLAEYREVDDEHLIRPFNHLIDLAERLVVHGDSLHRPGIAYNDLCLHLTSLPMSWNTMQRYNEAVHFLGVRIAAHMIEAEHRSRGSATHVHAAGAHAHTSTQYVVVGCAMERN